MSEDYLQIADNGLRLSPQQENIYKNLKNIGEEIAAFYFDGIKIINNNALKTKSYLLAHILREIEGGLRDILVVSEPSTEKCPQCNRTKHNEKEHIDRICHALGVSKDDDLAKQWHKVSKNFHTYAHRHGAWKTPREAEEVITLWNEFETVLHALVGTYLNLLDRIKRILDYKSPSEQIINTLKNILSVEALQSYFFKNLRFKEWLVPLKNAGFFDPKHNPLPEEVPDKPGSFTIPYWSVLSYLETVSNKSKNPKDHITKALLEIVNKIIAERVDNYRTDWIMLKVLSNLPTELITKNHIEFIRASLHSKWNFSLVDSDLGKLLVPKLINDEAVDLLLNLIDVMLDYKKQDEKRGEEYISIMDQHWLTETFKKHKLDISRLCGIDAANIAISKIKNILSENQSHFNNVWIPTIEEHPQISFPERYECQIVQFVRDMYEFYPKVDATKEPVKSLLAEEHPIFKRIAFHVINKHYDSLKDLFWEYKDNPLDVLVKHEIYELLKEHCKKFSDTEIDKLLEWIETKQYKIPEDIEKDEKGRNEYKAYKKKEWLSALEEIKNTNKKVLDKSEQYNKISPSPINHPGFTSWSVSGWVKHESPITAEELGSKSNAEIAKYLKAFKDEGKFIWGELTEISLTNTINQCVTNNPEKFSKDLTPLLYIQPIYVVRILWGIAEAWRNKQDFEWDELLDFMLRLIEPDSFWGKQYEKGKENYRNSTIRAIANIIKEGTRSDEHTFNSNLLPRAKSILSQLLDKTESDLDDINDIVTSVLNSTKGHIYEALINYSLRYARLYKKSDKHRWDNEVKSEFTKRLDRSIESSQEYSVILGQYMANLYYLDKEWVEKNIEKIFPKNNLVYWKTAMSGYLFYASKVYKEIYDLLRKSGQYKKALDTIFKDKFASEKLIQHICIGFIENWELLEDDSSLISNVISKVDTNQLEELTVFIWTLRGKLNADQKTKVKYLWGKIIAAIGDKLSQSEYRPIVANLSQWLALVDKIDDDIFEWMKQLVRCLGKDNYNYFIVEHLLKHIEKTPKEVGYIYIEMLSHDVYPIYKEEDIKKLVQKLYAAYPYLADNICNIYGSKGYVEILEDVYKEYHKKAWKF